MRTVFVLIAFGIVGMYNVNLKKIPIRHFLTCMMEFLIGIWSKDILLKNTNVIYKI